MSIRRLWEQGQGVDVSDLFRERELLWGDAQWWYVSAVETFYTDSGHVRCLNVHLVSKVGGLHRPWVIRGGVRVIPYRAHGTDGWKVMTEEEMANNQENTFWLVWSPQGMNPTYRHTTRESAEKEAERLAKECSSREFYAVEALVRFNVAQVVKTELVSPLRCDQY